MIFNRNTFFIGINQLIFLKKVSGELSGIEFTGKTFLTANLMFDFAPEGFAMENSSWFSWKKVLQDRATIG